jgi:hypothetical protein
VVTPKQKQPVLQRITKSINTKTKPVTHFAVVPVAGKYFIRTFSLKNLFLQNQQKTQGNYFFTETFLFHLTFLVISGNRQSLVNELSARQRFALLLRY